MNRWNPAARARNFVERIRSISEDVLVLRREIAALQREIDTLRADTTDRAVGTAAELHALRDQLTQSTSAILEVSSRSAARNTLRRDCVRVVFLVHNRDAWDAIGEVISIMRDRTDFDPVVVTIPHHYGGEPDQRGERRLHRFLTDLGVPHLRLKKDRIGSARELMLALDPDIVFRQSQWDADVDSAFSAENLAWTRLALIPYETMNPTVNVPFGDPPINSAVDQSWHRAAWLVFCANADALAIAQRDSLTGGRQFRALGHPKADALRRTVGVWPFTGTTGRPARVLWSAHHSILNGWNDFGMFARVKDDMLTWAQESPEIEFVFMYHPLLPSTVRRSGGPITADVYRSWLAEWEVLPNAALWRGTYAPVLAAADVLVTDGPSLITESQVLTVPTVFLERAEHIPFNTIGERIVTGVHRVNDVAAAQAVTRAILMGGDPLASQQRANVDALFGPPGAAQRIIHALRSEIAAERGTTAGLR